MPAEVELILNLFVKQRTIAAQKCVEKKEEKKTHTKFNCQLTYINNGIFWRVAAFSFPFLFLVIPDGSPGTVSQVLDLLNIFTRLFQYLREQPGKQTAGQSERSVISLGNTNMNLNCRGLEDIYPLKCI